MTRRTVGFFGSALATLICTVTTWSIEVQSQETGSHAQPGAMFIDRLNRDDAEAAYQGLLPGLAQGYAKSDLVDAGYIDWTRFTVAPYFSTVHSNLTVHIYANDVATAPYGAFGGQTLPVGSIVVKDGLGQTADDVVAAPMAYMEKMPPGFNSATGDWKFAMILPDGTIVGQTGGAGQERVQFCVSCHSAAADSGDWLYFPPSDIRASR